ncbi:DUF3617 domain-containing protein [Sphingosinicella sp. CPCC 101087]|uniref:DUF3617 domain-containing protein n=1 Tax=Sphingosinicella sp. CPCC 101087 TaxID=2497754 RepID=UPI00101C89B5|nr:DUF3617 domain-containing protein [Sphingosinicella sp. CPCC 101087]
MTKWSIAAAAALTLAACGGQSENEAGTNGEAAATKAGGDGGGESLALAPGQWEMSMQMVRMSGMPEGAASNFPATTIRTCLTPEEASRPGADFLTGNGENEGCTYENMSMTGGRMQGSVQCTTAQGTMNATFEGEFSPTSYEVTHRARMSGDGAAETEFESRITGRRIGDCPAGSAAG